MGVEKSPALMPYGEEWRDSRKLINMALSQSAIKKYHAVQEDIAALLNKDLLEKPNDFISHLRLAAGRVVLSVTYGLFAENSQDQYIADAEEAMDLLGKGMAPGAFLCDYFPIMKHIPTWMPFHWRKEAERGRQAIQRTVELPYVAVKKMFSENCAPCSFTENLLSQRTDDPKFDEHAMWAASAMYGAGTETTFATSLTFVLAMAMNQDIQKKAQLEIDSIIGTDRLPTIADAAQLPYTMAVIKETMRWHPSVPISVPRRTSEDDVFRGYHIPKNTLVIPNFWAISQNTSNPGQFNPDRYLNQSMLDPSEWIFGIGRRICPGRYLAENSLIAIICGILSAFDILPLQNETIHPKFSPKHISFPEDFPCQIKPRSREKVELIHSCSVEAKLHFQNK
ncbi:cytochrome P450 [Gymnopus androsaceus JB14]|uniref:Cytochrome P450 n=1 Tax=Gymnopus androsaceus JB14 TaxID=1447944 RepID=A0A6A4GGT1_9AGAR|nr:cytochrome P450 [Gymnopus androsaceus JB14]